MTAAGHFINKIKNDSGITLVEVLAAVTIMSIISVTVIGYFFSAMEKSTDQSRRVIAANLARLKVAEIRDVFRDGALFNDLVGFVQEHSDQLTVYSNATIAASASTSAAAQHLKAAVSHHDIDFDPTTPINGTTYRYLITFDIRHQDRNLALSSAMGTGRHSEDYLVQMKVSVYWTAEEAAIGDSPSGKFASTVEAYVLKRG